MASASGVSGGVAASCLALAALLTGCTEGQTDPGAPAGVANRMAEEPTGPEALLEGTVAEIDACFYIESPTVEGGLAIPVFPSHEIGETSDGEGFAFLGEDYSESDAIAVGGAPSEATMHELPEECDQDVPQWTVTPSGPAP